MVERVDATARIVNRKKPDDARLDKQIIWPKIAPPKFVVFSGLTEPSLSEAIALNQPDAYGEIKVTDTSGKAMITVVVEAFGLGKPEVYYSDVGHEQLAREIAAEIKKEGGYWFMPLVEQMK